MKLHKILTAILLCLCIFAYTAEVEAADLVTVIVADTLDSEIGDSAEVDFNNMRKRMQDVANFTGLNLREVNFKGDKSSAEKVLKNVQEITVNGDDVVLFYFSGHGYRPKSKTSPWPNLWFSQEDVGLEFEEVMGILEEKGPRLFIAMADACNNKIPDLYAPPLATRSALMLSQDRVRKNYWRLFMETSGTIKVTGSEVGQFAWGTNLGGLFTIAFLENLRKEVATSDAPDWAKILDQAAYQVRRDQNPTYLIEIQ